MWVPVARPAGALGQGGGAVGRRGRGRPPNGQHVTGLVLWGSQGRSRGGGGRGRCPRAERAGRIYRSAQQDPQRAQQERPGWHGGGVRYDAVHRPGNATTAPHGQTSRPITPAARLCRAGDVLGSPSMGAMVNCPASLCSLYICYVQCGEWHLRVRGLGAHQALLSSQQGAHLSRSPGTGGYSLEGGTRRGLSYVLPAGRVGTPPRVPL